MTIKADTIYCHEQCKFQVTTLIIHYKIYRSNWSKSYAGCSLKQSLKNRKLYSAFSWWDKTHWHGHFKLVYPLSDEMKFLDLAHIYLEWF